MATNASNSVCIVYFQSGSSNASEIEASSDLVLEELNIRVFRQIGEACLATREVIHNLGLGRLFVLALVSMGWILKVLCKCLVERTEKDWTTNLDSEEFGESTKLGEVLCDSLAKSNNEELELEVGEFRSNGLIDWDKLFKKIGRSHYRYWRIVLGT